MVMQAWRHPSALAYLKHKNVMSGVRGREAVECFLTLSQFQEHKRTLESQRFKVLQFSYSSLVGIVILFWQWLTIANSNIYYAYSDFIYH